MAKTNKCVWYITSACSGNNCKCEDYRDRRYKEGKYVYGKYVKGVDNETHS